ncbi:MAG: flippase-like domain-containing protein [Alphaproteobacteria bacterium]|nr:flippase-like domain-containing protein [Alphaproteobacteria bacterium]
MTDLPPEAVPATRRIALIAGKLLLTAGALWLVFTRIDLSEMLGHLHTIPVEYGIAAFAALNFAQIVSAARMRYYFFKAGHHFSQRFTTAIYYVGALFNIVLPGGISGDGYKAYFLKKHFQIPVLSAVRIMLSERSSGLCALLLIALTLALLGSAHYSQPYGTPILILGYVLLIPSYLVCIRLFLKEQVRTALGAMRFSLLGQGLVTLSAYCIFRGMGMGPEVLDYLALFMLSCVVAILPISIGGAGLRELTFLYGSSLFGMDPEIGIAASLVFFAVSVSTSLVGLLFVNVLPMMCDNEHVHDTP